MSRRISTIISGTCPVARGSAVGGRQPRTSYAQLKARSLRAAISHQGTSSVSALRKILSSMSVTLRMNVTA
jgi:hypothetical protein